MKYITLFTCENCEEIDDEVDYDVNTCSNEYGRITMDVDSNGVMSNYPDYESSDWGDSEWTDSPEFKCKECAETYSKDEIMQLFKVYELTEEEYMAYCGNELSKEDIVNREKEVTIKKKKVEKVDHDSPTLVIKNFERDCETGFKVHGTECPKCHAIQGRTEREMDITCNECGNEYNINNLTIAMYA